MQRTRNNYKHKDNNYKHKDNNYNSKNRQILLIGKKSRQNAPDVHSIDLMERAEKVLALKKLAKLKNAGDELSEEQFSDQDEDCYQ